MVVRSDRHPKPQEDQSPLRERQDRSAWRRKIPRRQRQGDPSPIRALPSHWRGIPVARLMRPKDIVSSGRRGIRKAAGAPPQTIVSTRDDTRQEVGKIPASMEHNGTCGSSRLRTSGRAVSPPRPAWMSRSYPSRSPAREGASRAAYPVTPWPAMLALRDRSPRPAAATADEPARQRPRQSDLTVQYVSGKDLTWSHPPFGSAGPAIQEVVALVISPSFKNTSTSVGTPVILQNRCRNV